MPHRATITVARPNPILPDQILDTELDEVSRGLGPRGEARAGQPGGYIARGPPASGQSTPDLHPAHISHPAQPRPHHVHLHQLQAAAAAAGAGPGVPAQLWIPGLQLLLLLTQL